MASKADVGHCVAGTGFRRCRPDDTVEADTTGAAAV